MPKDTKNKKRKNPLPFRLNILFIGVFLLFTVLILRLGVLQIVNGQQFVEKSKEQNTKTTQLDGARGKILDTTGKVLAGNKGEKAVTYTPTKKMASDAEGMLELAKKLSVYIKKDTDDITERDKKDYWISKKGQKKAYADKLSKEELDKVSDDKAYKMVLDRVNSHDLKSLDKKDMHIIAIWRELNKAMVLTPEYIKTDLSNKEAARIGEHLGELPGIDLTTTSKRTHPNGHPFYLGNVKQIPEDKLDYYLARGYDRNDKVGSGYLEQFYEDALNGSGATLTYKTDQHGDPQGEPKRTPGHRGDDMVLTLNQTFQKKVGKIIKDNLSKYMGQGKNAGSLNSAYAVAVNPQTGGILAMSGKKYENGKFHDVSYQTAHSAYNIGSSVKGATVLAGYQTGSIPGTVNDKSIHFGGKGTFSSYTSGIGNVNDITALEVSSNVYMGFIASKMAGIQLADKGGYYQAVHTPAKGSEKLVNSFKKLRDIYSQFGLGTETQIDFPNEGTGSAGSNQNYAGIMPQFAIGQYDTYTPIQMAQYVSTIANGGDRMQLHLMKSLRKPATEKGEVGKIDTQFNPNVLNHITMSNKALHRVQQGFWQVTHGNYKPTAGDLGSGQYAKYHIAGKTGTAQVKKAHGETDNSAFVGYAPGQPDATPEIAVAVMVPGGPDGHVNLKIAGQIFKTYFDDIKEEN